MRLLPVGKALSHIINSTLNNLRFAFHSQWPWVLILAVLLAAMFSSVGDFGSMTEEQMRAAMAKDPTLAAKFLSWLLLALAVGMLGFASVAVNWHRYILTDELPRGLQKLRVDATVWRYLGNLFLISLLTMVAALPVLLVIGILMSALGPVAFPVLLAALAAFILPVIYRLSVKLPAVALGRRDFTLKDAWRVTEGNWWQIAGLGLLLTLVTWGVGLVLMGLSMGLQRVLPPDVASYTDIIVQIGVNWVLTILGITTLTSLYGFFVEGRDF